MDPIKLFSDNCKLVSVDNELQSEGRCPVNKLLFRFRLSSFVSLLVHEGRGPYNLLLSSVLLPHTFSTVME
jgi:hypothetical protein